MVGVRGALRAGGVAMAMALAGAALCPASAAAEPWEGVWADTPEYCQHRVGETDGSPWRLTRKAFVFYEGACDVKAIAPIKGMRAWIADLKCASEGDRFNRREVLMLTRDGKLARFLSEGYLSEMVRCP